MKRFTVLVVLMVMLGAVLAACGGGDNGGGPGSSALPDGTFSKTVVAGGAASTFGNIFSSTVGTARYMLLYLPTDVNGAGNITSIALSNNASSPAGGAAVTCPNITVRMGLTSSATLSTNYASNVENGQGSFATVLNGAILSIPSTTGGSWTTINLSTPFYYNGVDSLVVDISRTAACSGTVYNDVHAPTTVYNPVVFNTNADATIAETGSAYNDVVDMRFQFSGGDNKIDFAATYSGNSAPLSTTVGYQKVQMLYNASSIAGSGPITGIALQVSDLTTAQTYTYTMKLGHSLKTDLTTTWADNFDAGSPVTVASSVPLSVPAGIPAGEFIWLPIPGSVFTYNGTDNLVVELTVEGASGLVRLATHPTANYSRLYGNPASASATSQNFYTHQIAFRFNGGTMDTVTVGTMADSFPFSGSVGPKKQMLYKAAELGTKGSISKVAFRLKNDSAAGTYNNFEIVMGHTNSSELTATFADNMTDAKTVYSSTFTIPAGLKAGDWIEVPLSSPFAYDGVRNLVVQSASDMGTATNGMSIKNSARYTNCRAYTSDRAQPTATGVQDYLADQRLWYSK